MSFVLSQVQPNDNLEAICAQMQPGEWGADNEMTSYQPEKLKAFLESGGILILAYDPKPLMPEVAPPAKGGRIAGAALCYVLVHPAGEDSLYVHELDTHPDYRRQGVATQLMQKAMEIAKEKELKEVWLGTEAYNDAANAFYKSLKPSEVEPSVIYSYETKPQRPGV